VTLLDRRGICHYDQRSLINRTGKVGMGDSSVRNAGDTWNQESALREMLGYLNFSQGKPDARFQGNISEFYRAATANEPWNELARQLRETLAAVRGTEAAFRDASQAEAVLAIVFERLLAAYRRHHVDLLGHLSDRELFQPFLLARFYETVLAEGGPWDETDRIVLGTLQRLNDFVGYRPVAVLERKKCEPYDHERVRPIPLYIRGAGVAVGRFHDIVARALEILEQTDGAILNEADFSLDLLDELALDPRAYDFGHPVNQRPNYQFGEWDPHCIDNAGRYRRFVVRQVLLDALLERIQGAGDTGQESGVRSQESSEERVEASGETVGRGTHPSGPQLSTLNPQLLFEAAAVLAGTMLMAAGTSGSGPDAHDSSVTLAVLVPKIARYRDAFYEGLLNSVGDSSPTRKRGEDSTGPSLARRATVASITGEHANRLRQEAATLRQPFGGARQHLNQYLARQRAAQLQHTHLARLFAEMGYPDASREQSRLVATASARITTEMECAITASHMYLDRGGLPAAVKAAEPLEDLLQRGIHCGAIVDPWNILGFQGQFGIFAALENTVPDPRVDQLTALMDQIFTLIARLLVATAAANDQAVQGLIRQRFQKLASWWDKFATVEVGDVRHVSGRANLESASHVAGSIAAWRRAGEAAGDIRFWREHAGEFNSPRAFAQVVDALLERKDYVAAMALLMGWLGQATEVPLEDEEFSFHELAERWLMSALEADDNPADQWSLVRKFFDYLEANADEYWLVPSLELGKNVADLDEPALDAAKESDDGEESGGTFSAAYEGVTFRDSAADGHEGELMEGGPAVGDFELEATAERIEPRLRFLSTLAILWQLAADRSRQLHIDSLGEQLISERRERSGSHVHPEQAAGLEDRIVMLDSWLAQLRRNQQDLARLVDQVQRAPVPRPSGSHDSLVEYDRRRSIHQELIYEVIAAQVESNNAARRLLASLPEKGIRPISATQPPGPSGQLDLSPFCSIDVERALLRGHVDAARALLPRLFEAMANVPLLYRRLDKGGDAREIIAARCVQQALRALMQGLPRAGLLRETYHVLDAAREMERTHPVGGEGITEFDRLFRAALRAIAESVLDASADWTPYEQADRPLLECLEELTEPFMKLWLEHSHSVRLSSLDRVRTDGEWQEIRQFIERYGRDVLTPKFLTFGNLRAILDSGVGSYFDYLTENLDPLHPIRLIDDLDQKIRRADAERLLELVMQVFLENFDEYIDYNTTTTQSDYGERFFILFEFLRLHASYERTVWNLQPLAIVHEVLARKGRSEAAHLWQDALGEKTAGLASTLLEQLAGLEKQFGVRLNSVRDRLNERFIRPLALDRIRILVEPAIEQARSGISESSTAFDRFQAELRAFTESPSGVGVDVPHWLRVLEAAVEQTSDDDVDATPIAQCDWSGRPARFSRAHVEKQLEEWDQPL